MPQVFARRFALVLLVVLAVVGWPASAKDPEPEQDPWLSFVQGKFTFIGREPDGGATYAGDATIVEKGGKLVMSRKVAGKTVEAQGTKEVPHPPGDGEVLRFRWEGRPEGQNHDLSGIERSRQLRQALLCVGSRPSRPQSPRL